MNTQRAKIVAEALGGVSWNSGGGINLVRIERADGHLVVVSDNAICEYETEEAFGVNRAIRSVLLH
jgi:hypothetical protein